LLAAAAAAVAALATTATATSPAGRPITLTAQVADGARLGCAGSVLKEVPAAGTLTNPSGTEGGHFWWRTYPGSQNICIGTIVVWAHYTRHEGGILAYTLYNFVQAGQPVQLVSQQKAFTLDPGWYYWTFPVHRLIRWPFPGNPDVCISVSFPAPADESYQCVTVR
jgi:hypothetical protein